MKSQFFQLPMTNKNRNLVYKTKIKCIPLQLLTHTILPKASAPHSFSKKSCNSINVFNNCPCLIIYPEYCFIPKLNYHKNHTKQKRGEVLVIRFTSNTYQMKWGILTFINIPNSQYWKNSNLGTEKFNLKMYNCHVPY